MYCVVFHSFIGRNFLIKDKFRLFNSQDFKQPRSVSCGAGEKFERSGGTNFTFICFPRQVPIFDGPMEKLGNGATYEELFVTCLKNFGVLCIGLYRFISFSDELRRSCEIGFV